MTVEPLSEQKEVDVLVVGAGAAGMTAALACRAKGLTVLVVEASDQVGGTTATSAGTLWLPCALAGADSAVAKNLRSEARTYLQESIGPKADIRKIEALLESGADLLTFLHDSTEVRLDPVAVHPDYLQHLPGASLGGRAFAPREYDGRLLGNDFARIRPPMPEFMVFGGMMVSKADIPLLLAAHREPKALMHAMKLGLRYAADRLAGRRGTRLVMGNALVAQLFSSALKRGVSFAFETRVEQLSRGAGGFDAVLKSRHGEKDPMCARNGVILAAGGFSGNAGLRKQWLPEHAAERTVAHVGNDGGGIELGIALNAATEADHGSNAFWMPVSTLRRADGSIAHFPHIALDRAKPGSLAVDASGQRFTNEANSYHHFCEAMLARMAGTKRNRVFLIADMPFVRRYGIGMIRPTAQPARRFTDSGYLIRANSPRSLAELLSVDGFALEQTLNRYNENAARGVDPDFHRGESALNRHNGDATHGPNPCLRALKLSELCAVELTVADLGTSAGLATDDRARVLDASGQAIPGLYACGNDMASMMKGGYPGPGTTLGPGMTFAWRAVEDLSSRRQVETTHDES
jgi:3-oxosteroid 1-dehydrogenase